MGTGSDRQFRRCALSVAVLCATGSVYAEDDEVERLIKPQSSISLGVGNWSGARPQQGIFDGMRDSGVYGLLDMELVNRDDDTGTWFNLKVRDMGLNAREARGEILRQGDIGAFIEYNRIPRYMPYTVNSGLVGFGDTTQTMTPIVPGTGTNYELGTVRDNTKFGFYKNLARGFDFKFQFTNEDKKGNRQMSRGIAPQFAVEPINSNTQQAEATLEYTGEKLQLSGGYYGSWYKNKNSLITANAAGTPTYLSLPLDNQAHQGFLNGGYQFTPTTRGTFKLAYTRATQNEQFATAGIAGLALAGAPTSLDGRVDTTLVQLGLTARPIKDLSLVGSLRYHDSQDKTPQARYVQTGTTGICNPATGTSACVDNAPMSFRTLTGKLEGTYRLPENFSLVGGLERREQDRTVPVGLNSVDANGIDRQRYVPFRSKLNETTYRMQLRRSMSETINASLAFLQSKRDGSDYTLTNEALADQINPLNLADRRRNKWRATIDWTPLDQLSLQFNFEDARDKYGTSLARPYGLTDGSAMLYSLDATYAVSDVWQVTAWFSYDQTKATQLAQRAGTGTTVTTGEKSAHLQDVGKSLGLGVRVKASEQLRLGGDLQWIRSNASYPETITYVSGAGATYPAGVEGPLPDIHNRLVRLKFFGIYAVRKDTDIRIDLIHERWRTDDWTWAMANGESFIYGTATTDGTTVNTVPRQTNNFASIRYIYRFQ